MDPCSIPDPDRKDLGDQVVMVMVMVMLMTLLGGGVGGGRMLTRKGLYYSRALSVSLQM